MFKGKNNCTLSYHSLLFLIWWSLCRATPSGVHVGSFSSSRLYGYVLLVNGNPVARNHGWHWTAWNDPAFYFCSSSVKLLLTRVITFIICKYERVNYNHLWTNPILPMYNLQITDADPHQHPFSSSSSETQGSYVANISEPESWSRITFGPLL